MRPRSDRHNLGVLLAATLIGVGALAALVPSVDAGACTTGDGRVVCSAATKTNTDPDKKIFVLCPQGRTATGGGAQAFAAAFAGKLEPGQHGRISIFQVIPSRDLSGYAARAQAQPGFRHAWHLTAYVICQQ